MNSHSNEHIRKNGDTVRTVSYRCRTSAEIKTGREHKECLWPQCISEREAIHQIAEWIQGVGEGRNTREQAIDLYMEKYGGVPNGNEKEL